MKLYRKIFPVFLILFFLALAFSVFLPCGVIAQEKSSVSNNSSMPLLEVSVIKVKEKTIEPAVELSGRVSAFRIAEVRPQINGIICKRLFSEGSDVKSKETLYQIDRELYQAALESAQANLAQAKAVEYAARLKAQRYKKLVETKAVSVQEDTEIHASWKQAQARVLLAMAAVKTAKINLNYTQIKAPISGRIGKSLVSEGALVTAQQPSALATIQQLDPVYVDVSQSADDLLRLKAQIMQADNKEKHIPKTRVQVLLSNGMSYKRMGELAFSDVSVDPTSGAVILRAIVPNPDQVLLPGMFVRAKLISSIKRKVLTVPQLSLIRNNKGQASVMVVNSESLVESRMVETGQLMGKDIIITRGIATGEQVVVSGLQKIRPGMQVSPNLITP